MPKFYGNSSQWVNSISKDGTMIFEEAENRLHVQKAILCLLMGGAPKK